MHGKQLVDNSVTPAKLTGGFLATLFKKDGSVPLTGPMDAGGQRITNVGQGTAGTDAATLNDIARMAWKDKVLVATTGNITLSGTQTIDGVAVTAGKRVLVRLQTNPAENGIWICAAGAWARAADADSADELSGAIVNVDQGSTLGDKRYAQTADNPVPGTDPISWVDIGTGTPAAFPANSNKEMTASVTTADYQLACATTIASTPAGDGYVRVFINGLGVSVGNGARDKFGYFSADGGTTAKTYANIAAGDEFYWVQSVALYNLDGNDKIDFDYTV